MIDFYEDTALTPMKAAALSGYIDWSSQPSIFKHYPEFLYRYKYGENQLLQMVELCRIITSRSVIGSKPYYQLNTPSAGNLHPMELYVQIRGIKGIISGIYHVDAGADEIVLIREIDSDGLEQNLGLSRRHDGMLFVLSCVPFRAEWKYAKRSSRYCYLDAGHQIAAVQAAAKLYGQETTIVSDFDLLEFNRCMGFKEEEFTCAVLACANPAPKSVQPLKQKLMHVSPTDYNESLGNSISLIAKGAVFKSDPFSLACGISREDILKRRSARVFESSGMQEESLEYFMNLLHKATYPLECFNIVLKEGLYKAGIYFSGVMIQEGLFADEICSLLVNQSFVKNADILTVMTSKHFSANKLMLSGSFTHNLYLEASAKNIGCSGIGAFYDKKLQDFLGTQNYILYVSALGKERI
ncbi:nitroreductase family protein [bacterium]|nr:nitroreductase family protein [bacterium]MBU1991371.1 nitroreductase family protein [bacterium]